MAADPNPFTTPQALAEFEQDYAKASELLDAVVALARTDLAACGEAATKVSTYIGALAIDPRTSASLLAVAIMRMAAREQT